MTTGSIYILEHMLYITYFVLRLSYNNYNHAKKWNFGSNRWHSIKGTSTNNRAEKQN